jgi:hypothetical protein
MSTEVNLARQPIFDREMVVCGYELLSRSSSLLDHFSDLDPSAATDRVIGDALLNLDLRWLTGGLPAYINFTRDRLVDGSVRAVPAESVVIELPGTIEPDKEVMDACRALRDAGYRLAMDNWVGGDQRRPLLGVVHEVKINVLTTDAAEQRALVHLVERIAREVRVSGGGGAPAITGCASRPRKSRPAPSTPKRRRWTATRSRATSSSSRGWCTASGWHRPTRATCSCSGPSTSPSSTTTPSPSSSSATWPCRGSS